MSAGRHRPGPTAEAHGAEEAVNRLLGSPLPDAVVGVGVDAVDLDRLRRVLLRRTNMATRLFTPAELAYARAAVDPVPRLSTRFAAKEATMKALGVGLGAFPFVDVEVVRLGLDPPHLVLAGSALALAQRTGVSRWHLSLTHTDRVAMAFVVAEGAGGDGVAQGAGGDGVAEGAGIDAVAGAADRPRKP